MSAMQSQIPAALIAWGLFGRRGSIDYLERIGKHAGAAIVKATIAPGSTANATALVAHEEKIRFLADIQRPTIAGRMAGLRPAVMGERLVSPEGEMYVAWRGEGTSASATDARFQATVVPRYEQEAIVAVTKEFARAARAADILQRNLKDGLVSAMDAAFIDPDNAGTPGVQPASISHDAAPVTSSGDISTDVGNAAEAAWNADIESSFLIMNPRVAFKGGLKKDNSTGASQFYDLGVRGGSIAGMPVIVSSAVPYSSTGSIVVMADATAIAFADSEVEFDESSEATLCLDTNPGTPSASTVLRSLWQDNLVATKIRHYVSWAVVKPNAIAVITDVTW